MQRNCSYCYHWIECPAGHSEIAHKFVLEDKENYCEYFISEKMANECFDYLEKLDFDFFQDVKPILDEKISNIDLSEIE